jgi:hypothetical protein
VERDAMMNDDGCGTFVTSDVMGVGSRATSFVFHRNPQQSWTIVESLGESQRRKRSSWKKGLSNLS